MTQLGVTIDELAETIEAAQDFLRWGGVGVPDARDLARAVVHLASSCVVGMPCEQHGGAVHGQEAEELRAGLEKIMADPPGGDGESNGEWLVPLRRLLDAVDARDSLAWREASAPKEADACA